MLSSLILGRRADSSAGVGDDFALRGADKHGWQVVLWMQVCRLGRGLSSDCRLRVYFVVAVCFVGRVSAFGAGPHDS